MKKFMVMAAGLMMAAVLGACAPTARNTGKTSEHGTAPAGAAQQETVDGVAEKESMVVTDADPTVTVCVYSVKSDKSGLKQNMDGIDGDELDAQELLDKMAEVGVIEEGITVDKFEQKDGALTLDLSSGAISFTLRIFSFSPRLIASTRCPASFLTGSEK